MTHRADQIIEAVAEIVRAQIGPAGANVFTHHRESLAGEQGQIPAISVDFGPDDPEPENTQYIDSTLTVMVTAIAQASDVASVRRVLLGLRRKTHVALMADPKLGLEFVIVTNYGPVSAPNVDTSGAVAVGSLAAAWLVTYRMNVLDPGDD